MAPRTPPSSALPPLPWPPHSISLPHTLGGSPHRWGDRVAKGLHPCCRTPSLHPSSLFPPEACRPPSMPRVPSGCAWPAPHPPPSYVKAYRESFVHGVLFVPPLLAPTNPVWSLARPLRDRRERFCTGGCTLGPRRPRSHNPTPENEIIDVP